MAQCRSGRLLMFSEVGRRLFLLPGLTNLAETGPPPVRHTGTVPSVLLGCPFIVAVDAPRRAVEAMTTILSP